MSIDPATGKGSVYNGPERRKTPPPEGRQHEGIAIEKYLQLRIGELENAVTVQKKNEEALTIERKRLFSLLNNLPAYVYLHSSDYSIAFSNRCFDEIFGKPGDRLCYEVLWNNKEPCEACPALEVLRTRTPQTGEWHGPEGHIYQTYHYPFTDIDGTLHALEMGIDISSQKQAEEALRREKRFSEMILESLPGIFFLFDDQGRLLRWNRNLELVSGFSPEEISKKQALDFVAGEDRGIVKQKIQEVFAKGQASIEAKIVSKDGIKIPFYFIGMNTVIDNVHCVIGTGIDITERRSLEGALKESETRFHSLFNAMAEGVALHKIIYDEKGRPSDYVILDVNPAYEVHTGIARKNAVGKKASELYTIGEPPYIEVYARVAATGKHHNFETYFDPLKKHYRISVFSPAKGLFATVFEDITERKQFESDREKLISELEDSLANVKTLGGLIPICASCKKVRDDTGYWEEVASYVSHRSEALFSHGLCPDCERKAYDELEEWRKKNRNNKSEDRE